MPTPNPSIVPGISPVDIVPEREDLLPEEEKHYSNYDADSKDGMSGEEDASEPKAGDFR